MNRDLIAQRCLAGGLSIHQAARRAGLDPLPIFDLPQNRHADGRIPLAVLKNLSDLLDIDLNDLLDEPPPTCVEPRDDIRIEAAIAASPTGLSRDDLAKCLDWPLQRVETAIAALEIRLRPSGRRLKRIGWHRYTLGPNLSVLTAEQHAHLARVIAAQRDQIDRPAATILRQIIEGWRRPSCHQDTPNTIRELLQQRLIDERLDRYEPSNDVSFSLRLHEN